MYLHSVQLHGFIFVPLYGFMHMLVYVVMSAQYHDTPCTPTLTLPPLPVILVFLLTVQADLARVHAEWKASEQVVREQMHTEHTLHIQGEALQEEVNARRNDIMKLLDEVTR